MLVIEVIKSNTVRVIHYAAPGAEMAGKLQNNDVLMEDKEIEDSIERVVYKGGVAFCPEISILRAKQRLGEKKYKLLTCNCESFVNWAITGEEVTYQGKPIHIIILTILAPSFAAFLSYVVTRLISEENKKDPKYRAVVMFIISCGFYLIILLFLHFIDAI